MKLGVQYIFGLILLLSFSCAPKSTETAKSIIVEECVKGPVRNGKLLVLDSVKVNTFITHHPESAYWKTRLSSFYKNRSYAYAWMNAEGLDASAAKFVNLLNVESIKKSDDFYNNDLHTLFALLSSGDCLRNNTDSLFIELELLLSANFFEYAHRNWKGVSETKSMALGWFVDRKKLNYEALLDTLLHNQSAFDNNEPVYKQYSLLKKQLAKYADIEKNGGWPLVSSDVGKFKLGDSSSLIVTLKKRLFISGDLTENDSTELFNDNLGYAIKVFQERHGLKADSVLGPRTVKALRVTAHERIEQILINMERCRWVPKDFKGDYLIVNIPDYKLSVYNNDVLEWTCKVVLGKQSTSTVIFNDDLEYIVFSPYWNVPESIIKNEMIASIQKNENYFVEHNMEVVLKDKVVDPASVNWKKYNPKKFPYMIRERPGPSNSLGLVKFLFPNSYNIYLHDTPSKSLFNNTARSFSHGCIRIEKPFELAQYLLRGDTTWTDQKILDAMNLGEEKYVKLKTKVPVYIVYFTAWIDPSGGIQFRDDVYGHDAKMKALLLL
ncbi:MAG: L,D-transpeptidase family protein [Bacteroidetes bacterium]|nr:L,D-transpeptidase family protein [Bacteroidota bacterium]